MSTEEKQPEQKVEEQPKQSEEEQIKKGENEEDKKWDDAASDEGEDEEEEQKKEEQPKEEPKPKKVFLKNALGDILITKLDDYVEPPKEVKEAKGDVRDANKYDFSALIDHSDDEEEVKETQKEEKKEKYSTIQKTKSR